jgi:putative SOS response-associated peptidase YedK
VPASGYYEWRPAEGGKQPYFISAAYGAVLSIAGLWDQWKDPETGEAISSATLIVTAATDFTRRIHDRMPVLLERHDLDAWLTGKAGVELLRSAPNDFLRMWPVSKRVNASGRGDDDPSLIEPLEDSAIAEG